MLSFRVSSMALLLVALALRAGTHAAEVEAEFAQFRAALPQKVSEYDADHVARVTAAAQSLEQAAGQLAWTAGGRPGAENLKTADRLLRLKAGVDVLYEKLIADRVLFAAIPEGETRRERARAFLQLAGVVGDLSGRLRYTLRDALDETAFTIAGSEADRLALAEMLLARKSAIGAEVLGVLLEDPAPGEGGRAASLAVKKKVIELISISAEPEMVPDLVELIRRPNTPGELKLLAADAIRKLGVPQPARPGQPDEVPAPPILPTEIVSRLTAIRASEVPPHLVEWRTQFLRWVDQRATHGVVHEFYRFAGAELKAGDWVLSRNPSPYNRFTDLSPGLFTHVGVVTIEVGPDGMRRFVVVDLPERGAKMPATPVDAWLRQSLHWCILRHPDPQVAKVLGDSAAATIGSETEFDLTFQTSRVLPLAHTPLAGKRISTYCAGFLLLCALQTDRPPEEFFPLRERAADGKTAANLAKMGLSIGDDFVSPTGALFSPKLELVARREPMYDPTREIKEAIYDHFAARVRERDYVPSPSAFQAMRATLAEVSRTNPWLARALARGSNVSEHMDLKAAAQAAAVVETLDAIGDSQMNGYLRTSGAIREGSEANLDRERVPATERDAVRKIRAANAELVAGFEQRKLTPRDLRLALVRKFIAQGQAELDDRFFRNP